MAKWDIAKDGPLPEVGQSAWTIGGDCKVHGTHVAEISLHSVVTANRREPFFLKFENACRQAQIYIGQCGAEYREKLAVLDRAGEQLAAYLRDGPPPEPAKVFLKPEYLPGDRVFIAVDGENSQGNVSGLKDHPDGLPTFFVLSTTISGVSLSDNGLTYYVNGCLLSGYVRGAFTLRAAQADAVADMVARFPRTVATGITITPEQVPIVADVPRMEPQRLTSKDGGQEPSTEEVMASVRRIISEDGDTPPLRPKSRGERSAQVQSEPTHEEILASIRRIISESGDDD